MWKKKCFFCYQNWYDGGITKISDILNQNQNFLKWHELAIKFNLKVPFIIYYRLVNAIPQNWKACLKNPIPNVTHDTTVNTLRTSSIYSSLLNTIFVSPTAETEWRPFACACKLLWILPPGFNPYVGERGMEGRKESSWIVISSH